MSDGRALSRTRRRRRFETVFRGAGLAAIVIAGGMLAILVAGVVSLGVGAFTRFEIEIAAPLDRATLDLSAAPGPSDLPGADYRAAVRAGLLDLVDGVDAPEEIRALQALVSPGAAFGLARRVTDDPALIGATARISAPLSDRAQLYLKGAFGRSDAPDARILSDQQMDWLDALAADGHVSRRLNADLLTNGDSSYPELAGVAAGVAGSFMAVGLAVLFAAPLGVVTAVFLEEFAPKNRWTDLIEINVNNLAAVPSIIFGLLGLTVFIIFFCMPRSAPLVAALVLSLMTLPTIIIATRAALRSLPSSLKEGAEALGASRLETVWDPLLPAAAPGIITGVILGFAQALGETAPLLLIGMVAFVATPPASVFDPASALPVLIYLWAESPERAFVEKTAGAIILLLGLLVLMNAAAAYLRRRFDPFRH